MRRGRDGGPVIDIGLDTAGVLVGSPGSLERMDDTVIGDGVTLTSRPESAGKDHGSSILRSGCTRERLKGGCVLRPVDRIRVRGGTEPAAVCEALDLHTSRSFDAFATTRSRAAGHAITY